MKTKNIAFCSIIISLALICSKIKIFSLPFGGSITLFSMLLITLPGHFYGLKYGIISSLIFSILKLILGGYIYNPIQAIIDYIFSYTFFGLSGFVKNHKKLTFILNFIILVTIRFIFACISGMIFFAEYVPSATNPLLYNILYNGTYIYIETIISIIFIIILPKNILSALHKIVDNKI